MASHEYKEVTPMLKLIVGTKGSGKTKTMIDMIDKATKTTSGNIVVIEKCMKLTTEINHAARRHPAHHRPRHGRRRQGAGSHR